MAPPRGHLSGTHVCDTGPSWPSCLELWLQVVKTQIRCLSVYFSLKLCKQ